MILKHMSIRALGPIDFFDHDFKDGLDLIKNRYSDALCYAMRLVLNHRTVSPLFEFRTRANTRIEATVRVSEKNYFTIITQDSQSKKRILHVYDDDKKDVTEKYLCLCSHCIEHDLSDFFGGDDGATALRFLRYANEDLYYSPHELSMKTDGFSDIKTFRAYLKMFIRNAKPETIRDGKHYEIFLEKNGRYTVKHKTDRDLPILLSESEQTLFRYLCFLKTAEFWEGFENMRNLHGIKKPLLVENFLERLDESIDTKDIFNRTMRLGRQVIVLTLPNEKRLSNHLLSMKGD